MQLSTISVNNFRGDLTDAPAETNALLQTPILVSLVNRDSGMLDAFGKGASEDIVGADPTSGAAGSPSLHDQAPPFRRRNRVGGFAKLSRTKQLSG